MSLRAFGLPSISLGTQSMMSPIRKIAPPHTQFHPEKLASIFELTRDHHPDELAALLNTITKRSRLV